MVKGWSSVCKSCQGTQFFEENGEMFCVGCQMQSQDWRAEEAETGAGGFRSRHTAVRAANRRRRDEEDANAKFALDCTRMSYEAFQNTLMRQIATLMEWGVTKELNPFVRELWRRYLERYPPLFTSLLPESIRPRQTRGGHKVAVRGVVEYSDVTTSTATDSDFTSNSSAGPDSIRKRRRKYLRKRRMQIDIRNLYHEEEAIPCTVPPTDTDNASASDFSTGLYSAPKRRKKNLRKRRSRNDIRMKSDGEDSPGSFDWGTSHGEEAIPCTVSPSPLNTLDQLRPNEKRNTKQNSPFASDDDDIVCVSSDNNVKTGAGEVPLEHDKESSGRTYMSTSQMPNDYIYFGNRTDEKFHIGQPRPLLSLAFLHIALQWLRAPVLLSDLTRWASEGRIPYLFERERAYRAAEAAQKAVVDLANVRGGKPSSAPKTFVGSFTDNIDDLHDPTSRLFLPYRLLNQPNHLPLSESVRQLSWALVKHLLGLPLHETCKTIPGIDHTSGDTAHPSYRYLGTFLLHPPMRLLLPRLVISVHLPYWLDKLALQLHAMVPIQVLPVTPKHPPPRAYAMAYIVIIAKFCFGLNGQEAGAWIQKVSCPHGYGDLAAFAKRRSSERILSDEVNKFSFPSLRFKKRKTVDLVFSYHQWINRLDDIVRLTRERAERDAPWTLADLARCALPPDVERRYLRAWTTFLRRLPDFADTHPLYKRMKNLVEAPSDTLYRPRGSRFLKPISSSELLRSTYETDEALDARGDIKVAACEGAFLEVFIDRSFNYQSEYTCYNRSRRHSSLKEELHPSYIRILTECANVVDVSYHELHMAVLTIEQYMGIDVSPLMMRHFLETNWTGWLPKVDVNTR